MNSVGGGESEAGSLEYKKIIFNNAHDTIKIKNIYLYSNRFLPLKKYLH